MPGCVRSSSHAIIQLRLVVASAFYKMSDDGRFRFEIRVDQVKKRVPVVVATPEAALLEVHVRTYNVYRQGRGGVPFSVPSLDTVSFVVLRRLELAVRREKR